MSEIIELNGSVDGTLSAVTLARQIEILAGTGFAAQLNALVVERQQDIDLFHDNDQLASLARQHQHLVKRDATATLSRTLPALIRVVAGSPSAGAALVAIVTTQLRTTSDEMALRIIAAAVETVKTYRHDAAHLAEDLSRQADAIKDSHARLIALIDEEVKLLGGPDGAVAQTLLKINAAKEAMAAALTAIVTGSNAMGDGVKKLFVSIVGICRTSDGSTPIEPFPVKGIGIVSENILALRCAESDLQNSTRALIQLYQQLERLKSGLAVVTSISVQIGLLETSLREAAVAANAVEVAWVTTETGFRALLSDACDGVPPIKIAQDIATAAGKSWKRLSLQSTTNKIAFMGGI